MDGALDEKGRVEERKGFINAEFYNKNKFNLLYIIKIEWSPFVKKAL